MLDASGRPQTSYREFVDHTKTKIVLAQRLRVAYDDLYASNKTAHKKSVNDLKGWFKSKTGKGDAVSLKMAATFKNLASYADFTKGTKSTPVQPEADVQKLVEEGKVPIEVPSGLAEGRLGLTYRLEIHLPDTQNIETYRSIFKALREELM